MKKKIFYRFFAVTLIAVLLMFASGIVAVNLNTKNVVNERLKEETELAATLMNEASDFSLFDGYKNNPDLRISIFDLNGNVLYESDTTAELENHANREEIINAIAGNPTTVERYSDTFKCDMTYYAVRTSLANGDEVVLRLAVRSSHITAYITSLIPLLIIVLAVSLIISFLLSNLLSRSVSTKVTEIGDSLKSLNSGTYVPIKTDMSEPELFGVLNQINELNANIHNNIRVANGERVKLNTVLDNVSQSIIALDKTKRIVFANKSALSLWGGTHRDVGRDLVFLIKNSDIYECIKSHFKEDYAFVCRHNGMDLSIVISSVTDNAISDEITSILIITDITQEKLIQKQKSDFFANASHELKTPITVMQGFAEVLMNKDGIDETSKKQIARIYKECLRLGTLISDMLMLSKIESGDAPKQVPTEMLLEEVTREVLDRLSDKAQERGITATVSGTARLTADQSMIFELVENLVSNAIKYNKDGGAISVTVEENGDGVLLKVMDTGIGIEKEHLPRLCERFYRVDKSHSKRIGGTGLGLAIVKHICAVNDADLTIDSDFGIGTTVSVLFRK
ncbi:MAG: PAS domain-containing protein [Clostridia bacterium]|nr:PAS domain-containing protein [Clostridia bacterium]